jgi:hypothetical protein
VTAYNGAAEQFPRTAARLEEIFGVTVVAETDPARKADFVVLQGARTPALEAPAGP